ISMYYDPMIAKLCTHAPTRGQAIAAMADALDHFEVEGIGHNLPFLSAVMNHPRFQEGRLTTAFIAEEWPEGFSGVVPSAEAEKTRATVAAFADYLEQDRKTKLSGTLANPTRHVGSDFVAVSEGSAHRYR